MCAGLLRRGGIRRDSKNRYAGTHDFEEIAALQIEMMQGAGAEFVALWFRNESVGSADLECRAYGAGICCVF